VSWFASSWWRDICFIGSNLDQNWFSHGVTKKLGNGRLTRFWCDKWVGVLPFCDHFPRVFFISIQKEAMVADVWCQNFVPDGWRLTWRRRLFEWEKNLLNELMELNNPVLLLGEERIGGGGNRKGELILALSGLTGRFLVCQPLTVWLLRGRGQCSRLFGSVRHRQKLVVLLGNFLTGKFRLDKILFIGTL
jgi:hypothetical protein